MPKLPFTSSLLCLAAAAAVLPVGCASGSVTESVGTTRSAVAAQGSLVISQLFGGASTAGVFNQDFVELFNPTKASVSLDGLSLQLAPGSGDFGATTHAVIALSGSVKAGGYFLVGLHKESGGTNLPTPDLSDDTTTDFDLGATDGKVLIATGTDKVGCGGGLDCPSDKYLDLVGYGGATQFEGSKITGLDGGKGAQRKGNGCTDTNDNFNDFTPITPLARNSATAAAICGGGTKDAGGDATTPIGVTDPDLPDDDGSNDSGIKTDAGKSNVAAGADDGCSVAAIGAGNVSAMGLLFAAGFAAVATRRRRRK